MRQTWINSYTSEMRHLNIFVPLYMLIIKMKQIAFHQVQGCRVYIYIQE